MRKYSVLMALGLLSMLLLGLQLSASPTNTSTIEAEVNIHPEVLNLKRKSSKVFNWERRGVITAYISNLTNEDNSYDVHDINVSTVKLYHKKNFVAEPLRSTVEDNILIVKFDATVVADYVWSVVYHMGIVPPIKPKDNYTMEFTVSGELLDGEPFAGEDTIKIIFPESAT